MTNRVYVVEDGDTKRFVECASPRQAIHIVARRRMTARVASQKEMMQAGVEGVEILQPERGTEDNQMDIDDA